ncbi:MAG: radical SAM protein [bacterium]
MKRARLVYLINPKADCFTSKPLILNKVLYSPLAGLLQIASLFPREKYELILTDENIEPIDFDLKCDLVCISAMTSYVKRGYEIADSFRKNNIPVIMGGIHPSFMPEEALMHADAVCAGEAELVFDRILSDLENDRLKGIYKANALCDLGTLPTPRMDLIKRGRYINKTFIQTARGCPTACAFCAEHLMNGVKYRFRPIDDVVNEIKSCGDRSISINDVDVFSVKGRTTELLTALRPLDIKWQGAVSCRLAHDEQLLELAAKSGCNMLSIGFESISRKNLKSAHKMGNNPDTYARLIEKIHSYGIMVFGLFIFGFDSDDEDSFPETLKFAIDNKIDACGFSVMTPYPGTMLFYRMLQEKRITSFDWDKYDQGYIVYKSNGLSPEALWQGHQEAYRNFYSYKSMLKRYPYFSKRSKTMWLLMNMFFRRGEVSGINVVEPIIDDDTALEFMPSVPRLPLKEEWRDIITKASKGF